MEKRAALGPQWLLRYKGRVWLFAYAVCRVQVISAGSAIGLYPRQVVQ